MPTELEQAAENFLNSEKKVPKVTDNHVDNLLLHTFKSGAEWQQKQTEDMLTSFFSREAVIEILNAASRYMGHHNYKYDPQLQKWFNTNYPPVKSE